MSAVNFDPFGPALSPIVLASLVGLTWLYIRGATRPRLVRERVGSVRHYLFAVGVLLLVLAFDTPVAPLGQQLFAAHQIQHVMIRLLGPMLVTLAYPWPVIRAGLPHRWRHRLNDLGNRKSVSFLGRTLTLLGVSFVLFIASLYLWQVPMLHTAALAFPPLGLLAHLSMVLAGILFFAVVFDRRGTTQGATQSLRVLALVGVILSNILLGSLTTMKTIVLYTGYDNTGRPWGFAPLVDETFGGYTIWVPSSMIIIVAIILVFNGWNAAEERHWESRHSWTGSNAAALELPETAYELRLKVTEQNRRMGQTLALSAAAMFAVVMITAITLNYAL